MKTTTLATVLVMTAAVAAAAWLAATPRASVPAQAEPEVQRVVIVGKRLPAAEASAPAVAQLN